MPRSVVSAVVGLLVIALAFQGAVGGAAADDVTLTITVVDSNGIGLSGIDVSATWNDGNGGPRTETTRANGQVLIDVPEGSDVRVQVDDDRYVRNRAYTLYDVSSESIRLPVARGGSEIVAVEDPNGPVADATVQVRDPAGELGRYQTGADGTARTDRFERGQYTVRVSKAGYSTNETTLRVTTVEDRNTVRLSRDQVEASFAVSDDHFETAQPVANATISIPQAGTTLRTLTDGTRTTDLPVNRDYEVTVSKEGYESTSTTLRVGERAVSYETTIQRTPSLDIRAANQRVVLGEATRVTVTNAYDEGVQGATISVNDSTVGQTDASGQIDVPIDQAGNVTIEATDGTRTASLTVEGIDPSQQTPTAEPTVTPTATETPGALAPGFGVLAGVVALLAVAVLAGRRG